MLQTLYFTKFGIPAALEAFIAAKEVLVRTIILSFMYYLISKCQMGIGERGKVTIKRNEYSSCEL